MASLGSCIGPVLLLVLFIFSTIIDIASSASFLRPIMTPPLVPSQVVSSKVHNKNSKRGQSKLHLVPSNQTSNTLVPAQVAVSSKVRQQQSSRKRGNRGGKKPTALEAPTSPNAATTASGAAPVIETAARPQQQQLPTKGNAAESGAATSKNGRRRKPKGSNQNQNQSNGYVQRNPKKRQPARFGNLPDIEWGAVPMEHLRLHPRFVALPPPDDLPLLRNVEDVRNIRQDSWQWDALHEGRCTTSQAVAALGFLESKAGRILQIPSAWQRRGLGAYHRLQQPALRTLEEMNAVLLPDNTPAGYEINQEDKQQQSKKLWKETHNNKGSTSGTVFAASYLDKLSNTTKKARKHQSIVYSNIGMGIRMVWGNAQEATSVLTALNYFTQQDPGIVFKEIGMCGAGLALNQTDGTSPSSLLVGATPDAVIEHPDGTLEALEVKNHCPFVLQLEMYCLGPKCRSAVMVRQTATNGALILRIHRDEKWIEEMLYWLQRFQQDFVERGDEPMANFFFDSPTDGPRYLEFLQRTKVLANQVDLVAEIPHKSIQRANPEKTLFLD